MILRQHQERTIAATQAAFRRVRRVLITAPTGFGKTAVAAVLIARAVARGRRVLFLVHLREVVLDTARRLRAAGVPCGVLMAGEPRTADCVQVASIQTVCAREDHPPADLVVWDECFPAGTTVDGRPIESLRVGDSVEAFDEALGAVVARQVTHAFKSRPSALVRLWLDDGTAIVATPGHPFYVGDGRYEQAAALAGRYVFRLRSHDRPWCTEENVLCAVPDAREFAHGGGHEQALRQRENDGAEPHAAHQIARADVEHAAVDRAQTEASRGQRDAASCGASSPSGCAGRAWSAAGVRRANGRVEGGWRTAEPLQDRRSYPVTDGCCGDRRGESLRPGEEGSGREEGSVLESARVDRVEVLEPGRDGTFGGLCRDGHVYNIEVDGLNNYFAGGVLVHNCHHAAAQSYREVAAQYPGAWHLGLTATPERADGQGLRDAFDEIVVGATVRELVDGGFLAPLDIVAPSSRLQGAIACEPAEAVRRYARGRPTVVFCRTVESSRARAAELGPRALHVDGATATPERDAALTAFAQGDADVLCNVFVLTEGWDCERAEVCVMARGCGSASMLLQAVGRVRRLTPGSAKRALLVDLGGVVHEHGHPDEDRSYTLDGITRRPRADRPWLCQCRVCGAVVEGSRRGPRCACGADWPPPPRMRVRRAELTDRVEIVSRIERDRVFAQLQRTAEQRGYKPAWAAVRFKDRFGFWPRARGGAA